MTSPNRTASPVLVVGATGATGRHVVRLLLEQGRQVKAVVRSKEKMHSVLEGAVDTEVFTTHLVLTESPLQDLSEDTLYDLVKDAGAVVSCLGHDGIFSEPKRLVLDSVKRLSAAMIRAVGDHQEKPVPKKLIVMSASGVPNPDGTDDPRSLFDRVLLKIFLYALPPHIDNEETALYVHSLGKDSGIEWAVVRPSDLIDADHSPFELYDKPHGTLFRDGTSTRKNVAKAMVDLVSNQELWEKHKFTMPTIYDKK